MLTLPARCTHFMKYLFMLFASLWSSKKIIAQPGGIRYKDTVFSASDIFTVVYGSNINYVGIRDTLKADVYMPVNDTATERPLVVFMHGGGFMNGHRNDIAVKELCNKIAARGYVTASIDYRLGIDASNVLNTIEAAIRAAQDLNGFIRYAKSNASEWKIDTNKIFISGSSAGAIAMLAKAFTKIDSTAARFGIHSENDLEGNTNDLPFSTNVAGAFSMWGAVFDTSWIQRGDIPIGCVHSVGDSTVPYNSGYNRKLTSIKLYGSFSIYNRAISQGIQTTLHGYESGQHDLGIKVAPYKDTTAQLMADFFYSLLTKSAEHAHVNTENSHDVFIKPSSQ